MKDASLCNYLIKVLSNNCGLSCTPKAKGGIRTSVLLDFVQQEESLPCRSNIQELDFYIGLRKGQLITRQDSSKKWEQNQTLLWGNLSYTTGPGPVRSAEIESLRLLLLGLRKTLVLEGSAFNCWGNLIRAERRFPPSG